MCVCVCVCVCVSVCVCVGYAYGEVSCQLSINCGLYLSTTNTIELSDISLASHAEHNELCTFLATCCACCMVAFITTPSEVVNDSIISPFLC